MKAIKKALRILFITIGVILLLLIILPIVFKSKIESLVKEEVNKQVEATVDWDRFSLTFFRGFPDLSVNLHGLSVVGLDKFEGDTLVGLKRFEFRVSPFSALKKNVIVKSILLDKPLINGIVLEDGTANYDIVPSESSEASAKEDEEQSSETSEGGEIQEGSSSTDTEATGDQISSGSIAIEDDSSSSTMADTEGGGSSLGIALKRFAIQDARISYNDIPGALEAAIGDFDLELKGDFSMDQTEVQLYVGLDGITAKMGGVRYMRNGEVNIDIEAAADMVKSIFTLKKNEISINGLVLGAEGVVEMPEDGSIVTDLKFFTRETSFRTLLSLVPAIYLADFESLETRGSLALEGTVKGVMKDSLLPDATLKLVVADGYFSYPDLPKDVSDVQIKLNVNYNGTDMDATTVALDQFHLLLGGNPFDIALNVDHPFSDMHVAGMVKGMIDFATLKDIVPLEDLELDGRLDADLGWDTKMSYIENEQFEEVDLDGRLVIEGVHVEAPDIPVPVELQKLAMFFTPRYVNLETVNLMLGSSDLHLDGRLTNFIPYVFDDQTVSGSLNVSSSLLDANEFLAEESAENETEGSASAETEAEEASPAGEDGSTESALAEQDSTATPSAIKIPENIDFAMVLDLKKLVYDNIIVENLEGNMGVKDGVANLDELSLDILKGNITVNGLVDTRKEFTETDVTLDMVGIDIPTAYSTFMTIEKLAPIAKNVEGTANIEMDMFTQLDAAMSPVYESINAKGHIYGRNLKVEQPPSLMRLSAALKSDKLQNLYLEKADIRFAVKNGRVYVDPFDINYENSKIIASGSHGIDQTMDYLLDMDIAKADLGAGANELMNAASTFAAGAGFALPQSDRIKVKANITGTFKDPKVSTDLSGNVADTKKAVKKEVEVRVKEEVKKVEAKARDEASVKAAELIKEAEAQKAKLVAEAEVRAEQLRKEAKAQGDKLIKDAGNNPIKKLAAQKAADELVKQADKKADQLVSEAEAKGDTLIAKAKEEAGKL